MVVDVPAAGQRLNTLIRERPRVADVLVTLIVIVLHIGSFEVTPNIDDRDLDAFGIALSLIPALLTLVRRTHPVPALAVGTVLGMAFWMLDYPGSGAVWAIAVLLYSAAVYASERRRSTQVLLVFSLTILGVLFAGYVAPEENEVSLGLIATTLVLFQFAWLAGDAVRNRRMQVRRLEEQMRLAQEDRIQVTERAVDAERNRIARELHDVVAHAMSVIVVQSEGAKRLVGRDDDAVREALRAIEHTGRTNLNDIRGIVGLLRTDGTEYAPSPELAMVEDLIEQRVAAGQSVQLEIEGERRPLPTMIELSGYRVVQESLTNSMKYAGPHATSTVTISYGEQAVDITVSDDGRGAAAESSGTLGHGLLGMRERVEAFGGELTAGPRVGGGFIVSAHLPISTPKPVNS
jgi:signal transduction histidine kinase